MKTCSKCGETKDFTKFTKSKAKTNYTRKGQGEGYHAYCKTCNAELSRQRRLKFKETNGVNPKNLGRLKNIPDEHKHIMSLIRHRFACARARIQKKNMTPSDLDEQYLWDLIQAQNFKCRYTGIEFVYEKRHLLCPSLDQIIPSKGYMKGNVQWISWACNWSKGDMDEHNFLALCNRVTEHTKNSLR